MKVANLFFVRPIENSIRQSLKACIRLGYTKGSRNTAVLTLFWEYSPRSWVSGNHGFYHILQSYSFGKPAFIGHFTVLLVVFMAFYGL